MLMPHSIILSGLSWSTPDGRSLFTDLHLAFNAERTGLVGRNGTGKTTLLKLMAGQLCPPAGTVASGSRVGFLQQQSGTIMPGTVADTFGVGPALATLRLAENGELAVDRLDEADWTLPSRMETALLRLGLAVPPDTPLSKLSGGQRTRVRLAALVFQEPDFLLLDEPTNDLDRNGRDVVMALLSEWRKGAVVVSHDRDLLDRMDAIVELTSLGITRYGGNWTAYMARKALDVDAAFQDLAEAEKRTRQVTADAQEARERQARRDSAGNHGRARQGLPRILLGARKNAAQNSGGAGRRMADRRMAEATAALDTARSRIEIVQPLAISLQPSRLPAHRSVLTMARVTGGYDPARPVICDFDLSIVGPERIAVCGPNGSGKTTLLSLATGHLRPISGEVRRAVPPAMLDQSVSLLDPSSSLACNFRRINPQSDENACRAALARFMFRADAALQTAGTLSGGQLLRAGLACTLGGTEPPQLLILDEPTNHLDTESVAVIEAGLRQYDGALLVVSHDDRFLEAIGVTRRIQLGGN